MSLEKIKAEIDAKCQSRQAHLDWCKKRALEYLDKGDVANGVASMLSDLNKHEDTALQPGSILSMLGIQAAMSGDVSTARRFVIGFN